MSHQSLKDRLARFLKANYADRWIASGDLQRIVAEKTTYSPQNVGRRMRELENEGIVEVKYVRGHAYYRYAKAADFQARVAKSIRDFDALPA